MGRARVHALSHDQILTVVRRANSSAPMPMPPRPACKCQRCLISALAELHRQLAAGAHTDPAAALGALMHERVSQRTLLKAARGELRCKERQTGP